MFRGGDHLGFRIGTKITLIW